MKLKAIQEQNVPIVLVSGAIVHQDVQTLKNGVTNLMKLGKNRIIVDFMDQQELPPNLVKELVGLNVLAKGLAGEIILSGLTLIVRMKIAGIYQSAIRMFSDQKKALTALSSRASKEADADALNHEFLETLEKQKKEIDELRSELSKHEAGEMLELRKANAQLKNQNEVLREQIQEMVILRRHPYDADAMNEKIRDLEQQIEDLIQLAGSAPAAKA